MPQPAFLAMETLSQFSYSSCMYVFVLFVCDKKAFMAMCVDINIDSRFGPGSERTWVYQFAASVCVIGYATASLPCDGFRNRFAIFLQLLYVFVLFVCDKKAFIAMCVDINIDSRF